MTQQKKRVIAKRALHVGLPLIIALSVLGWAYLYLKPKATAFIEIQIEQALAQKTGLVVEIDKVNWSILPPTFYIEGIRYSQRAPEDPIPKLSIQNLEARLDIIQLISGKLTVARLSLDTVETDIDLDRYLSDTTESPLIPLKEIFEIASRIPIDRIAFNNIQAKIKSKRYQFEMELGPLYFLIHNQGQNLDFLMRLRAGIIDLKKHQLKIPIRSNLTASLTPEDASIDLLEIYALNSEFKITGEMKDFEKLLISPQIQAEVVAATDFSALPKELIDFLKMDNLQGKVKVTGAFEYKKNNIQSGNLELSVIQSKINQFIIGDIQATANLSPKQINFDEFLITTSSGLIDLTKTQLNYSKSPLSLSLSTQLNTEFLDLNELLYSLSVGKIPLELFIESKLNCGGDIYPNTMIQCKGMAQGNQLEVRSGPLKSDIIAQVEQFSAFGGVEVTKEQISWVADINMGTSKGKSKGRVEYKNGFDINFEASEFFFSDVSNLANLNFEGRGSLKGNTRGNSKYGVFSIQLSGKDIYFEDFYLGHPNLALSYQDSALKFSNIESQIENSKLSAEVLLDLKNKRIEATGKSDNYYSNDLLKVFERIFKLPFDISALGSININLQGPLSLGNLSYQLKNTLQRGVIAGESFDSADFSLVSNNGNVQVKNAQLKKNMATLTMSGTADPSGKMDVLIKGSSFRLEESENISRLGAQISGVFDLEMQLKGPILSPDSKFTGKLSELSIEEQLLPPSTITLEFGRNNISGNATLLGEALVTQFNWPFSEDHPFSLNLIAKDWNYTTLLTVLGGAPLLKEYSASLSGDLQLSSERGGIFNSSGSGTIKDFLLKRGELELANDRPMQLSMKNGLVYLENFKVTGKDSFIEANGNNFSANNLNMKINGKTSLRLFQIFLPFLEELSGLAEATMSISGPLIKPEILGSAKIQNGFIKIKGFPHPLEQLKVDTQFSQSKILFNNISGAMAGGALRGDGNIEIKGPRSLPTKIQAELIGVNFNVPDKVRTSGNASVLFSGDWFPFTLSGSYHVDGGIFEKDFTDQGAPDQLRQSSYLPKMILQSAFEPIKLDLQVLLRSPLMIKNNLIDGSVSGQIQITGVPSNPIFFGRISTERGTKVTFRDKIFEVNSGLVNFNDPREINPELYVSARTRVSQYDVNLLVQGTPKNPLIRMNSNPPLAENDIISLLALGVTTQELEQRIESNEQQTNTASEIGTTVFNNLLGGAVKETTGFDIKFSSQIDSTNNVTQRITLSRKISEKLSVETSRLTGQQTSTEVKLQYLINPNVSAVGSWQNREEAEDTSTVQGTQETESIFGLDLEFKREFK